MAELEWVAAVTRQCLRSNLFNILLIYVKTFFCDNFDKQQSCLTQLHLSRLFNITIALYGTLSGVIDHGFLFSFKELGLIVDAVYCSVLLFIFCDCSHTSTLQVAQGVQDTLLSINTLSVDTPTQKEIDIFIQAIAMNPAIVSLKGYAEVNRELLTSVSRFFVSCNLQRWYFWMFFNFFKKLSK